MKRLFLLSAIMMMGIILSAQTQQGYVKTKGRLAKDGTVVSGTRIPNVTIQVKGRTPVISQTDGRFSFPVPEQRFSLTNVLKKGYVLSDPDILSHQYSYSPNDMIVVMETPLEQWEDKHAAESAIYEQLQKRVDQQRNELDELREKLRLSDEEYSNRLQHIFELYDENEMLVHEMAQKFASIDYDQLDENNRKIQLYILSGQLTKADSLIHSKGPLSQRVEELRKHQEANAKEKKVLLKRQEQLDIDIEGVKMELEDIANDCRNEFDILRMQHEFDSAAYYIELRAGLDSTRIEWILEAGDYYQEYLADYDKALTFYQKALKLSLAQNGELNELTASSYYHLGYVSKETADYDQAKEYYEKSKNIYFILDEHHPNLSSSYNNLGVLYDELEEYDEAIDYLNKALEMCKLVYGEKHFEVAETYNNLGVVYRELDSFDLALENYGKALEILKDIYNEQHSEAIANYVNTGAVYNAMGQREKALACYDKALAIQKSIYGEDHPNNASIFNNMGSVYEDLEDYPKALVYYNKARSTWASFYGEIHPVIAYSYNNIGTTYYFNGEFDSAFFYINKALSVFRTIYGENSSKVASLYSNIGVLYYKINEYDKALEYHNKALLIRESTLGENHSDVAMSYNNLGNVYARLGDFNKSIECLEKSLTIKKAVLGDNHPQVALSYNNLGATYCDMEEYEKALANFEEALRIRVLSLGEDHPASQRTRESIKKVKDLMGANTKE